MNIAKIKQFVKQTGDKFIFIENGEPELVVMSFREYERLTEGGAHPLFLRNPNGATEAKPEVKSDPLLEETEFVAPTLASQSSGVPVRIEDIRLEDLPL